MPGVKLYLDLMSQPARALQIFCRASGKSVNYFCCIVRHYIIGIQGFELKIYFHYSIFSIFVCFVHAIKLYRAYEIFILTKWTYFRPFCAFCDFEPCLTNFRLVIECAISSRFLKI